MQNKNLYSVKVARSRGEVEGIRGIWESMQYHPNADIDFFFNILESRKDISSPHIIVLYLNEIPRAMAICRIDKSRIDLKVGYKVLWKTSVRSLTVIYGGLLGEFSSELADRLVDELMQALDRNEADVIYFSNIRVDSIVYEYAKKKPMFLCRDLITIPSLHWKMTLPATIDEFYQKMKSKHRYWIRRVAKQLEQAYPGKVVIKYYHQKEKIEQFCSDAETIACKTYQRGLGAGFIDSAENRRRLNLASEHGWLRAYILYVDDKPCAFWIGTLYKQSCVMNFTGYDQSFKKFEPGTILFMDMIKDLCLAEAKGIDFGLGNAFYKERFGDQNWKEAYMYIYPRTFKWMVFNLAKTSITIVSLFGEKIVKKIKLRDKLKKMWRHKLQPKLNIL